MERAATNKYEATVRADSEKLRNHNIQLRRAHERYGVPLDLDEAAERTLEHYDLSVLDSSPMRGPAEQVVYRMNQGTGDHPGFNYPDFVETKTGETAFIKMAYAKNMAEIDGEMVQLGGLRQEAGVLKALREAGYQMPQLLEYCPVHPEGSEPDGADLLEMLVVEAVPPELGAEREPEDWTPGLAQIAAQKIRTFERRREEVPFFDGVPLPIQYEELKARNEALGQPDEIYDKALAEVEETYPYLNEHIIVHGDTWPRNVIVRNDEEDMVFVDWELAAPGYKGQDAARMVWGLTLDNDWQFVEVGEKAETFIEEWCRGEGSDAESAVNLRFGVVLESLRWISDRQVRINDSETDEATRISLMSEVADVKAHALKLLEHIAK